MTTTNHRTKPTWMLALLACVLLLAGVVAGCTSASPGATTAGSDKQLMLEAVAKWYVAQGALDMPGFKAGIYDPENILGVATMTVAPEGATKQEVKWAWAGENITITVPSEQSTITINASPDKPNTVVLKDATGQGGIFVMKKIDGVWKIDVAATQQASLEQAASEASESAPATGTK